MPSNFNMNGQPLNISIYDTSSKSVREISDVENVDPTASYIPPKAFECLLNRARKAATEEVTHVQ